jgi:ferredoxin
VHRISVDGARCTGHGRCYSVAPHVLEDDDEGFVTLCDDSKLVSDAELAEAEAARLSCPEHAITVTAEQ